MPKSFPWKAILPAPYTFASISENQFYKDETDFMFKFAQLLNEEIKSLAEIGFSYIQLSDPALVYEPTRASIKKDKLALVNDALKVVVKGAPIKTCLQTFFGDFSRILPEALDFPVDHLGIDLYETNFEKLKEYSFEKGVALGLVDSRSSLVENQDELFTVAKELIDSIYRSKISEVFICPNCDLEFLPWERAEEKMNIISSVAKRFREEFNG
jgi:5-methyltetrahydropteroyltriglutamate--homocysteine methyltransferase